MILNHDMPNVDNNASCDSIFAIVHEICLHLEKGLCNFILMRFITIIACINTQIMYITNTCQSCINNALTTTYQPLTHHSLSPLCPITYHSVCNQPPLNKTASMICFVMLFFIVHWKVVYSVSDGYGHEIDYLSNKVGIILSKLISILLKVTILMTKQLSYWFFGICNVIEDWISWNYCVGKYFNCLSSYWRMFDTIGYIDSI